MSVAEQYGVELLGSLPLDMNIREQTDHGNPIVMAQPESKIAKTYGLIARKAAAQLSRRAKDYSSKFPNIVIENK